MKTPREILLKQHETAGERLDGIRHSVIAQELGPRAAGKSGTSIFVPLFVIFYKPWRELILPSRRIWTALAAVWLLLVIINVSQRDTVSSVTGKPVHSPAVMMGWQAQQRLMNELLVDRMAPPEADRPRNIQGRPRTEDCETRNA